MDETTVTFPIPKPCTKHPPNSHKHLLRARLERCFTIHWWVRLVIICEKKLIVPCKVPCIIWFKISTGVEMCRSVNDSCCISFWYFDGRTRIGARQGHWCARGGCLCRSGDGCGGCEGGSGCCDGRRGLKGMVDQWMFERTHLSHEKNPLTFHYTGCLIGILIMVYCNPHIIG